MAPLRKARLGFPFFWVILGFCLMGIVAIIVRCYSTDSEGYDDTRATARLERLTKLREDNDKKLNFYTWADKAKGVVHIPIELAMELTVTDLKSKAITPSAVKADPNVTLIVPPYMQPKSAAATTGTAAPASTVK